MISAVTRKFTCCISHASPMQPAQRMHVATCVAKTSIQMTLDHAKILSTMISYGSAPPPDKVVETMALMGSIPLRELGFNEADLEEPQTSGRKGDRPWYDFGAADFWRRRSSDSGLSRNQITFMEIYEDPSLTMGIFCFPPGASIPLHDHPGMTVFSR
ncbi:hypothetical protein CEUSTIGMA_g4784.t1 [Chlamydomonas eustigma]|uniref:cysteine dioxygenase n=1 Tax=Chlamydomonas eustigma TaxID=1157962 RepID=A0A250X2P2_9CHLO|nr:hypothetical protein CEUSTIGMA_g4784.t1 [Chlamydomonas eustigma]|eukprot:GAX77338.1 hypothetical protein CEUSTIGMA_g4784.t1 [Chlamydomonas eustigma]